MIQYGILPFYKVNHYTLIFQETDQPYKIYCFEYYVGQKTFFLSALNILIKWCDNLLRNFNILISLIIFREYHNKKTILSFCRV
jgi:hypothetical protein